MSACPTGCDVSAPVTTTSKQQSVSQATTGASTVYELPFNMVGETRGTTITNDYHGSFNIQWLCNWQVCGIGVTDTCTNGPFSFTIPGDGSVTSTNFICDQLKPEVVPAFSAFTVVWRGTPPSSALYYWNAGNFVASSPVTTHFVTSSDCTSVKNKATTAATNWESSYVSPGIEVAHTNNAITGISCSPAVGQTATTVTGFATGSVTYQAYNASDARGIALTRLTAQLPAGYFYKNGSLTSCNPTNTTPSALGGSFTITCAESGLAVYNWTSAQKSQLASALVGKTLSQALALCNSAVGVAPNTCSITLSSQTQLMPTSASAIAIVANTP